MVIRITIYNEIKYIPRSAHTLYVYVGPDTIKSHYVPLNYQLVSTVERDSVLCAVRVAALHIVR